jgi:hypothetical protein
MPFGKRRSNSNWFNREQGAGNRKNTIEKRREKNEKSKTLYVTKISLKEPVRNYPVNPVSHYL